MLTPAELRALLNARLRVLTDGERDVDLVAPGPGAGELHRHHQSVTATVRGPCLVRGLVGLVLVHVQVNGGAVVRPT